MEYDSMDGSMSLFFNGVADGSKTISVPHRDEKPIAERHKDFIIVMCGNTYGKGSIEYSGRDFQDMALMDRFRMCTHFVDYHKELEKQVIGVSRYSDILQIRKTLEDINSYLSTRNIIDIAVYIGSGKTMKDAIDVLSLDMNESDTRKMKSLSCYGK